MNPPKNSLASQRTIVFITAEYPFGQQETFVENEIIYLSDAFDQIVVLPKSTLGKPRTMPPNCSLGSPYGGVSASAGNNLLWKEWLRIKGHIGKSKVAYRSWQSINKRLTQIKASTKDITGEITYYSYWLDEGAMAAACLSQREGRMAISRAHGWDVYPFRHPHKYLPFRQFLAKSELTVCPISNHGLNALRSQGFNKLALFYLGTHAPTTKTASQTQQNQGNKKLVSVSSIIALKRVKRIAQIFVQLRKSDSRWQWHHFGDGPLEGELRHWLQTQGVDNYHLHGRQTNETVHDWLNKNHDHALFINQSTTEGLPVSMMEAMSYGIPCVGTNVGGVSEIIDNGNNGLLHGDDLDPNAVARSIEALSTERLISMGKNAKKSWENHFNAGKNYKAFIKALMA